MSAVHCSPEARQAWLGKVRHDLVKRMLWVARDLRDLGRQPRAGELATAFMDEVGSPVEPLVLWKQLCEDAPEGLELGEFETALQSSVTAASQNDLAGVLALEGAFEKLRRQCQ
jgi:hypothetical protein